MQEGQVSEKHSKLSQLLVDIRNGVICLACIAVAYSAVNLTRSGNAAQSATVMAPINTIELDSKISNEREFVPMSVIGGKLTVGNDGDSSKFKTYLQGRVDSINNVGPVVYSPDADSSKNESPRETSIPESISAPAVKDPAVNQVQPAPSLVSKPDKKGTYHSAPFVDAAAKESIREKTTLLVQSGRSGTVKIGYHLDGSQMTNSEKQEQVRTVLTEIPDEWTISYKSPKETVRLYVFTDTTCPYCLKLHKAVPELLEAGISVQYFLFPRDQASSPQGTLSRTATNMKNIWCSVDQNKAIDEAFDGYRIAESDCAALPAELSRLPAPVPDHFEMGSLFDVRATPTWFASNGNSDDGFTSANKLIQDIFKK